MSETPPVKNNLKLKFYTLFAIKDASGPISFSNRDDVAGNRIRRSFVANRPASPKIGQPPDESHQL